MDRRTVDHGDVVDDQQHSSSCPPPPPRPNPRRGNRKDQKQQQKKQMMTNNRSRGDDDEVTSYHLMTEGATSSTSLQAAVTPQIIHATAAKANSENVRNDNDDCEDGEFYDIEAATTTTNSTKSDDVIGVIPATNNNAVERSAAELVIPTPPETTDHPQERGQGGGVGGDDDDNDDVAVLADGSTGIPSSFWHSVIDRSSWLVGLLIVQSMSSFIISHNEQLLQQHIVIVQFLTMLVGSGGNAGNQASVGVIRGLAIGTVNGRTKVRVLYRELRIAITLCIIVGIVGCIRVVVFRIPLPETIAITTSLMTIVFISVILGAVLPLIMHQLHIDPAHSSTTIQVLMDILGVLITVHVCGLVLDRLQFGNATNTSEYDD